MSDSSPMMQQYERIKAKHQDAVLFFRMGDFYEMFRHDAVETSRLLSLTLTSRAGVQMCGIPYHSAQNYIQRLLAMGKKIAICEQTSQPGKGKGIVEREVIQVLSPGTLIDDSYLGGAEPNWLLSFSQPDPAHFASAAMDLSTGEILLRRVEADRAREVLLQELAARLPREILIQESLWRTNPGLADVITSRPDVLLNRMPDWHYDLADCEARLSRALGTQGLFAFGLGARDNHLHPLSALLLYAQDAARHSLDHIRSIRVMRDQESLVLDETSIRNLELIRNLRDGGRSLSLLWALDQTQSPMGARLLRQWILEPCASVEAIEARLDATETLYRHQDVLASLRKSLGRLYDVERLGTRLSLEKAGPKDLMALGRSADALEELARLLEPLGGLSLGSADERARAREVSALIQRALVEEPPFLIADGGAIREGYHPPLDELRALARDSQKVLDRYLDEERATANLPGLRIKQNKIIGYYLELSRSQSEVVPAHFMRKHSTIHAERFTTRRLMELEDAIEHAGEEARQLEIKLFSELRRLLLPFLDALLSLGRQAARADVYASFAWQATVRGYVRPRVSADGALRIKGGRHPVVEACVDPGTFVPNDLAMDSTGGTSLMLLTGPNMAGKSTFLRQTALIVLMAHMGSFVPAEEAEIGLCDRIFCRVGASDNLAGGESTFLVEMHETAAILRGASARSLIIMDEVGRGTSTRDGLSIAWAVLEHIAGTLQCRCLFATHFHELTRLPLPGVANHSMAVREAGDHVVFLRTVIPGPSDHSYGIHVASMAGVPAPVTARAQEILDALQVEAPVASPTAVVPKEVSPASAARPVARSTPGLDLFSKEEQFEDLLRNFSVETSSPLEALNAIAAWKKLLL